MLGEASPDLSDEQISDEGGGPAWYLCFCKRGLYAEGIRMVDQNGIDKRDPATSPRGRPKIKKTFTNTSVVPYVQGTGIDGFPTDID